MRKTPEAAPVSNDYPRLLFRHPATRTDAAAGVTVATLQDGAYDTAIADDAEQHKDGNAEGWHDSPTEAKAASEGAAAAAAKKAAEKAAKAEKQPPQA